VITPQEQLGGKRPSSQLHFTAWMALLAQPIYAPPDAWYLKLVTAFTRSSASCSSAKDRSLRPLMISRKHGEKSG